MTYQTSFAPKLIYVFRINDDRHKNCLKIGDATVDDCDWTEISPNSPALKAAAKKRIKQYTQTAGIEFDLLHTEPAIFLKNKRSVAFRDLDVHNVLKRSGIRKKDFNGVGADEWFETDLETAKKAIAAVREGRDSLNPGEVSQGKNPIVFRPEQKNAIEKALRLFKKKNQMLWNAKMRFGKTLSALQLAKEMRVKRTLILTHRPVVNDGWFEDFNKIFADCEDYYQYGSKDKGNTFEFLERNAKKEEHAKYVYFASMQDLRGSETVGGNFDKNSEIFKTDWDLLIVDEAHEGTKTQLGKSVLDALIKKRTKILQLSGTPFNLLDEYEEGEIYTWDYVMEQRAKAEWDVSHPLDPNPYAALPRLNIFTFDLGKLVRNFSDSDLAFNFHEFFRTDEGGKFVHESEVNSFLNLICRKDENSNYPFSTEKYRDNFRHSLWMLPGVAAAKAMSKLLKSHKVFSKFEVVNVAGNGDDEEENNEALQMVREAIGKAPEETYTITLSCGRLTTGVSVPEWTAVFMLSGSANTSAASYMQTIFRVQTPASVGGKIKKECFVFDFAPDRTLKVLAETAKISAKAGKTTPNDKKVMGEFLNFCPVIGFDGTRMRSFDVEKMLAQLKRIQIERVVNNGFEDSCLYNDELLKLGKLELKEFDALKRIIGSTKAQKKTDSIDVNKNGLTEEEYEKIESKGRGKKSLTPEEQKRLDKLKEARKQRDAAASILRGISIRMPLMIYGADLKNENGQITIDNFESLVDDASWAEFMPRGVTKEIFQKFKKYYEEDVFREAGKRIREMVRLADDLSVEQRINRIGNIFNRFRNPDKETVLTPWRVVNMHIGEAFGGYVFFDKNFDGEKMLETPRFVDLGKKTDAVFSPGSRILEINSKSGLYPLYMAYGIYRAAVRREYGSRNTITIDMQRKLWNKVVAENIFVICKTPMAVSITRRTLLGFQPGTVNAKWFENLETVIAEEPGKWISRVKNIAFWNAEKSDARRSGRGGKNEDEMKFDAVVGNPPYQITTEGTSDTPIYHRFMDASFQISDVVSLITPARYLFNAGKTPKEWNEKILNDEHFKIVWYKPNSTDVFPNVDIKGGVAVCLRNANEDFGKMITYTAYPELNGLLKKVVMVDGFTSIDKSIYPQNKFELEVLYQDFPEYKKVIGSGGRERRLTTSIFEQLDVFKETPQKNSVEIMGLIKNNRVKRYLPQKYLEKHANLEKYKVLLPASNGSGAIGEVLSTPLVGEPLVGEPLVGYTQSFISIGSFETKFEANACLKYVKSRFARVMLGILKVTQHNHVDVWKYVPLQDFTANSDIDWSKSIAEIDRQLYAKYKLSAAEIRFIETHVKAME